jgi:serine/tyrosine/threonine adenylyltransferase
MPLRIPFDNSYARLPERFYTRTPPVPVQAPRLIRVNAELAQQLGIDPQALASEEGVAVLAGNRVAEGSEPIAQAYAGHQFGGFVPQLGDGRAVLLGEVVDDRGRRYDVQLKGSGRTPFSRGGDGRAALGPVLREYVVSEAMHALGVPTTRSLAAVLTGDKVVREEMLPGGVLTRVASSHVRVGTFQYFAARGDYEAVRLLADHVIARHYPDAAGADQPYGALLDAVALAQAELISRWLLLGFIHGVMNTDNTAIAGETIDYGPCAFMDAYNPATVYSAIDRGGRYAYNRQPAIGEWNMARFAETLLPLLDADRDAAVARAHEALAGYGRRLEQAYEQGLVRKLGIAAPREGDAELARGLLQAMADNGADFTLTFRRLADAAEVTAGPDQPADAPADEGSGGPSGDEGVRTLFIEPQAWDAWAEGWRRRLEEEPGSAAERAAAMRRVNPAFIPRNHLVERVIRAAVDRDDLAPFHELVEVTSRPFDEQPGREDFMRPPEPHEQVRQTFCGT